MLYEKKTIYFYKKDPAPGALWGKTSKPQVNKLVSLITPDDLTSHMCAKSTLKAAE